MGGVSGTLDRLPETLRPYSVRGFTAATGTSDPEAIAQLWNPSSARRLLVLEVSLYAAGAPPGVQARNSLSLQRTSARGTPGSTVTPDADSDWAGELAPPSGALLDLAAFTVQPTLAAPELDGLVLAAAGTSGTPSSGMGFALVRPEGIWVPPGTGLLLNGVLIAGAVSWPTSEVTFEWAE